MPTPFQLSEKTRRVVDALRYLEKGTAITYQQLSQIVGETITASDGNLTSARRILLRDHAHVWNCVKPGVGVKRLTDAEIADRLPSWWLNGARNKLRRAGSEEDVVQTAALSLDQLARFSIDCIQRHLAFDSLSRTTRNRLERVARGSSNDLPAFNALEWALALRPRERP
jgi:hypothetical protein